MNTHQQFLGRTRFDTLHAATTHRGTHGKLEFLEFGVFRGELRLHRLSVALSGPAALQSAIQRPSQRLGVGPELSAGGLEVRVRLSERGDIN